MGGQGCFSNGALHWIELVFDSRECLDGSRSRIVAFDLAEEQFRETSVFIQLHRQRVHDSTDQRIYTYRVTVWVMKKYGIEKSWTMFLRIPLNIFLPIKRGNYIGMNDYLFPVHILKDGKVLMSCDDKKLVLYDLKEETKRTVLETSLSSYAVVYLETLISPRIGRGADISKQHKEEEEEASKKHAMASCLNL
ncbi:hypothetical protein ACLB2K_054897 [Fragaria x ananassa]